MIDLFEGLTQLGFHQAMWLLPVVIVFHVFEELPRFPAWGTKTLKVPYTRAKFIVENVVLFATLIVSLGLTATYPMASLAGQVGLALVLGALVGVFLNMVFHAYHTLKSGEYSPGTVTACLLFPPVSIYLYYLAAVQGVLTLPLVVASIILGVGMLPIVVTLVHYVMDRVPVKTLVKFAMLGLLPLGFMPIATALFDPDTVYQVMFCAGPLGLLPLGLKAAARHRRGKKPSQ